MVGKGGGNGCLITHCGECVHTLAHCRLEDGMELFRENLSFFALSKEGLEIESLLEAFDDDDNVSVVETGNDGLCTSSMHSFSGSELSNACSKFSIFSFSEPISCSFDFIIMLL